MRRRKKRKFYFSSVIPEVESDTRRGVVIVFIFLIAVLSLLSIFDLAGNFGHFLYKVLKLMFGWGFWIFPLVLLSAGYLSLRNTKYSFRSINWLGMFLLIIGYSGFFHLTQDPQIFKEILKQGIGGGYIGMGIAWPLYKIMGRWASLAASLAIFLIGLLLMFNTSLENLIDKLTFRKAREKIKDLFKSLTGKQTDELVDNKEDYPLDEELDFVEKELTRTEEEEEQTSEEVVGEELKLRKKTKKKYPRIEIPLSLLSDKSDKPTARDVKSCQEIIKKTLANFGVEVEMGVVSIGPTVTQYTLHPAEGIKLSRIIGLGNDLALALAAHPLRIEAPIPGKALVGIEVPNKKNAVVPLRHVLESEVFKRRTSKLSLVLGQDVTGKPCIVDLAKLPHLLVAGQTGSGKTVCLNSIILSLLYQNQPDELKFILVDPKRVEMPIYDGIPYLLSPVITDVKKTINALKWTISEMERRFHVLSNAGKRNIQSYNVTHPRDKLPYLVFIIDELADLMSMAPAEVEAAVIRLAQMSRAVGIHLILATQRPSVDIITGLIKANIPGRVAFAVASLVDSRTILDSAGAEKLLGRGDMLFTSAEISKPKRLQGAFCSDEDIERVVEYLRAKAAPDYEQAVIEKAQTLGLAGTILGTPSEDGDELLGEARQLVVEAGKASASYLQRRLRIGYARAARILDLLEEQGVIGPADGSKPRDILVGKGEKSLVEQADEILEHAAEQPLEQPGDDSEFQDDHSSTGEAEDGQGEKIIEPEQKQSLEEAEDEAEPVSQDENQGTPQKDDDKYKF